MNVLTPSEIRYNAPSVFATEAHQNTSDKYAFISSVDIMNILSSQGWFPVKAFQSRTRKEGHRGFTKHQIRFRKDDAKAVVGDTVPEIVLINAHDRAASASLLAGLFRFVCANGMTVRDSTLGDIRVRHTGDAQENIIEGVYEVVERLPRVQEKVKIFNQIPMDRDEQMVFAETALTLRWEEGKAPTTPEMLNMVRRRQDQDDSLWTVYNRIQENMMKGGLPGRNAKSKFTRTRAIKSVDADTKLNQALWALTERFAQLKGEDI